MEVGIGTLTPKGVFPKFQTGLLTQKEVVRTFISVPTNGGKVENSSFWR